MISFYYIIAGLIALATSAHIETANDEARLFGYRYTHTEILPKLVTSLVPSSCVQVEASLPPCRHVRNLEVFPRFLGGYVEDIEAKHVHDELLPTIHTTPLGWGEYFGIYAPTVTVTAVHLETTTVLDPRTVVTFSVKGCKPSRLPLDLHLCPPQKATTAAEQQDEIKPTPTAQQIAPTSTAIPHKDVSLDSSQQHFPVADNALQPAEHAITNNASNDQPTQRLNKLPK